MELVQGRQRCLKLKQRKGGVWRRYGKGRGRARRKEEREKRENEKRRQMKAHGQLMDAVVIPALHLQNNLPRQACLWPREQGFLAN